MAKFVFLYAHLCSCLQCENMIFYDFEIILQTFKFDLLYWCFYDIFTAKFHPATIPNSKEMPFQKYPSSLKPNSLLDEELGLRDEKCKSLYLIKFGFNKRIYENGKRI